MKDLDFDELDRAVNSLIANDTNFSKDDVVDNTTVKADEFSKTPLNSHFVNSVAPDTESKPQPDLDTPQTPTPLPEVSPDLEPKPELKQESSVVSETLRPVSPLVSRRSSGRFMDVVHPSSDMRTALVMPERVSRQGNDVNPVTATKPVEQTVHMNDTVTASPITEELPDSTNLNNELNIKPSDSNAEYEDDSDIDQINDEITNTLGQIPEVQESPFLSGAKVSKRPLGAFSTEPRPALSDLPMVVDSQPEKPVQSNSPNISNNQIDVDAPLPPELQSDLLSIESACEVVSDETPVSAPAVISPAPTYQAEEPSPAIDTAPARVAVSTPPRMRTQSVSSLAVSQTPTVKPTVDSPTSISQQYQEKPNTGDQHSGAIYDTDSYHKAVVHPAKKSSGWLWVLWVVLLLAIGAGVGAAIYFFVLPIL